MHSVSSYRHNISERSCVNGSGGDILKCYIVGEVAKHTPVGPKCRWHTPPPLFCHSLFTHTLSFSFSVTLAAPLLSPFLCHNSLQMLFISQARCRWKHSTRGDSSCEQHARRLSLLCRSSSSSWVSQTSLVSDDIQSRDTAR